MWSTILNVDYYGKPNREIPEPAAPFSRRILEELIDEEAAHVDAISYCLFTAFESDVPSSKVTELFRWRPPGLDAAGIDPLKILIDRCHHHGMQFIADIRMNDRHGAAARGIAKQHPEWTILGTAYNYALGDVRNTMLAFDQEVLDALVDYLVPSDFMHTDTNMKTEDFVKLAKGTTCKIYPAIHNRIGMDEPNEHYRLMTLENLRAAAQNYYHFGADGISPYNFQFAFERRAIAHRSSAKASGDGTVSIEELECYVYLRKPKRQR